MDYVIRNTATLLFVALTGLALPGALTAADAPPKLRLTEVQSAEPKSYKVDLTLDPEKTTFTGHISIQLEIGKPLQVLWLNQSKIQIKSAVLTAGGKKLTAQSIPGGDDFVGLQFPSMVPAGTASLAIDYSGVVIEKNSSAIFRQVESGNWYIFSQFEPTDARGAFPCFDDPYYKTPWQLTLHIPVASSAVSNTLPLSEKTAGGTKTIVFRETKPLPSYLVAFGVGPFEYVPAGVAGKNKIPVRIVVPKGKSGEAKYAAEVTATILNRLEDYFGIPFPYEKSDQVAIPNTVGFGAMENPGMVTYVQSLILADPKVDAIGRQRSYAMTAAHELAHQWFGDLVTTAWWDDIWLNEAFATWMERKLIEEWKPEWKTRVTDVAAKLGAADEDSLISARKIRQEILAKDDILNAFDGITYQKGASVIGMFENWMGKEEFRTGVQAYLKQYAWRATTAGQFLDSLSTSSKKNVTKSFSTFLNQAGVPTLAVSLECNGTAKPQLQVEQTRFLPTGSKGSADQTWNVPMCVRYGTGTTGQKQCALITEKKQTMVLEAAKGCPAWVQANHEAIGYYRVEYKGGLLKALTSGDVATRLSAAERSDLMGNAKALADAGKLAASDTLTLAETFHNDSERNVLQMAVELALSPAMTLVPDNLHPNYQRYLQKNFLARARELTWTAKPGEPEETTLFRPMLLRMVSTWGNDKQLADEAKSLAEKWLADHSTVSPNLAGAILRVAAYSGDKAFADRLLATLKQEKNKQVRQVLLSGLRSFRDREAILVGMKALVRGEISFLEAGDLLFGGQMQDATRKMALEFLKSNWDVIVKTMPTGGGFDFGSSLPRVGATYCDVSSRDELKAFFAPRVDQFLGAPRSLDQTLEGIDLCIASKATQSASVAAFLGKY